VEEVERERAAGGAVVVAVEGDVESVGDRAGGDRGGVAAVGERRGKGEDRFVGRVVVRQGCGGEVLACGEVADDDVTGGEACADGLVEADSQFLGEGVVEEGGGFDLGQGLDADRDRV
jgi:hypothetical protein